MAAPVQKAYRELRDKTAGRGKERFRETYAAVARQVAERRAEQGLSQTQLAEMCGTTQSAIARLESGQRPPRIDTLLTIADALGCDVAVELHPRTPAT